MNAPESETGLSADHIELLHAPALDMSADALLRDLTHYFGRTLGRRTISKQQPYVYQALTYAVRDRLMERWNRTNIAVERADMRRTCYMSLEFLMGRLLTNSLISLDLKGPAVEALNRLGLRLEDVAEREHDAGLGNGGLGRLAACFLDSCATLQLPVIGYGIRYQYGMFHQRIENGYQVEEPDPWLRVEFPWEIERIELSQTVRFGGHSEAYADHEGKQRRRWVHTHDVLAIPYDVPIPGYRNDVVNTLRLWSAAATDEFDLDEFNAGDYADAVAAKNEAENITMVLYPNAATESGQELRLRQQYFLVSASLQDIMRDWRQRHGDDYSGFAEKLCVQLNDTHPALAVPELMRLLMDHCYLSWNEAWEITSQTMAYTNHTLLPEALEQWPVAMFETLLPRLLEIIYEINARFIQEISAQWPGDNARIERMSLISPGPHKMVRMAYLSIVGSFSINGVAQLHSYLLQKGLFQDFAELWPERFNNKTNGVTPRRWLAACNPGLSDLISSQIGTEWTTDLPQLAGLAEVAEDPDFQQRWRNVRAENKQRLAKLIETRTGLTISPAMLFDVQVKRIHEYKRQLLNLLHAVYLYDRNQRGQHDAQLPRAIIIGGKAAPGYVMAKNIIKAINNVAKVINSDRRLHDKLRLIFLPDYNVSAMEVICTAADLSEQISTAGKEASGTGNMKFMMNGAITIGTLDGANVEIREAVGDENFFLFGLTVEQIEAQRATYNPQEIIASDADFARVISLLESGHFNRFEPGVFDSILHAIRDPHDPWMTAADFRSFIDAQERVAKSYSQRDLWTAMSIRNTAASGTFSTDRTIKNYNDDIWRLDTVTPLAP
ncbi:glycogen/starch/alpha-glucan phosphorylase [Woeseia oceani]|uniref:Alpha-1,4 glucan phosphorylase n=1 Tax=Woeseia oceani TaxID=1548547 RepID=A0A193LH04_9GAMM|nr:glycogen phosphorylase [Woeseia oceani]